MLLLMVRARDLPLRQCRLSCRLRRLGRALFRLLWLPLRMPSRPSLLRLSL
jgi:hypothetical protein